MQNNQLLRRGWDRKPRLELSSPTPTSLCLPARPHDIKVPQPLKTIPLLSLSPKPLSSIFHCAIAKSVAKSQLERKLNMEKARTNRTDKGELSSTGTP